MLHIHIHICHNSNEVGVVILLKKIDIFKKLLIKLLLERSYPTKLLLSHDYQIKLFYLTRTIPLI